MVIIARAKHLVPSRTQQLSALALMVLRLKAWESKSSPNLISSLTDIPYLSFDDRIRQTPLLLGAVFFVLWDALRDVDVKFLTRGADIGLK